MEESYLGVIQALGFQFAPTNWGYCNGTLIAVSQNQALYSLLSNAFGGDGRVSFALPDLQGRTPIGQGRGPGQEIWQLGEKTGQVTNTLSQYELPPHTHTHSYSGSGGSSVSVAVAKHPGTTQTPEDGDFIGMPGSALGAQGNLYVSPGDVTSTASIGGVSGSGGFDNASLSIDQTGQGRAFSIMQPSLVVNYCICMQGYYPSRS